MLNKKDHSGWSLIHWAIHRPDDNSEKIIQLCLDINIGLEQRTGKGFWNGYETPLHIAIRYSNSGKTQSLGIFLLNNGADSFAEDQNGWTALHWACNQNCYEIAMTIIHYSPELLIKKDKNGNTPLHLAAEKKHLQIAKLLLKNNIKLTEINNNKSKTPIELAADNGYDLNTLVVLPLIERMINQARDENKYLSHPHDRSILGHIVTHKYLRFL